MSLFALQIEDIMSDLIELKDIEKLSVDKKNYLVNSNERLMAYITQNNEFILDKETEDPLNYISKICLSRSFKTHNEMKSYVSDFVSSLNNNDLMKYSSIFYHYYEENYNNRLFFT